MVIFMAEAMYILVEYPFKNVDIIGKAFCGILIFTEATLFSFFSHFLQYNFSRSRLPSPPKLRPTAEVSLGHHHGDLL